MIHILAHFIDKGVKPLSLCWNCCWTAATDAAPVWGEFLAR